MRSICLYLIFLLGLNLINENQAWSVEPIPLTAQGKHFKLTEKLSYWIDNSRVATLNDAAANLAENNFVAFGDSYSDVPKQSTVYWYYFQVDSDNGALEKDWLLELDYLLVKNLKLFQRADSDLKWVHGGELQGDRAIDLNHVKADLSFNLPLPIQSTGKTHILVRAETYKTAIYTFSLWEEVEWRSQSQLKMVCLSLFYGAFLVMIVYNFVLFLGTREQMYLIYTAYVVSILLFSAGNDGFALWFFPIELPAELRTLRASAAATTGMLVCLFTMFFLDTKSRLPRANIYLKGLSLYMLGVVLTAGFISVDAGMLMVVMGTPIISFSLWIIGFRTLRDGHKEARLFLVGWSALMLASIYKSVGYSGALPYDWVLRYCMHIGSAIEIVFLSLALADRINSYKELKEEAERAVKKELLNNNEILEESNRIKNEFIATISHELRTPLNGIIGAIELASIEQGIAQREKYHTIGLTSALKMNSLVNDMLVFSELLTQEPELKQDLVELKPWINSLILPLERYAHGKGLGFHCMLTSTVPDFVEADKENLGLIISHLLDNAIKFTQQGEIYFKVKLVNGDKSEQPALELEVKDTGCGIDAALQAKIFESYRQLDGSFSRSHGGLGIGLALVEKLIQMSGGSIKVDSEVGVGSIFKVTIPVVVRATQNRESETVEPIKVEWNVSANEEVSILVVEDNAVNQKILCKLLDKLGCRTTSALNGCEAVDACEHQKFDLIFMDCQMPVMNGFEATLQIRQLGGINPVVPIVAVTANATEHDRSHCMQVGMNEFVKKPVNKALIENVLIKYLKQEEYKQMVL